MKSAQSILEFVFAFIVILLLSLGIVRVWTWFNANYAHREVAYQRSRASAGAAETYKTNPYVDIAGAGGDYTPLNLTEDWVFSGKPSGMVGTAFGDLPSWEDVKECCKRCSLGVSLPGDEDICHCDGQDAGCGTDNEGSDFNPQCTTYTRCLCRASIRPTTDMLTMQRVRICGADVKTTDEGCNKCPGTCGESYNSKKECESACKDEATKDACRTCLDNYESLFGTCGQYCNMLDNAKEMDKQAEKCDDPWELCWWGSWGGTADELRNGARELRTAANELRGDAMDMKGVMDRVSSCCEAENLALENQEVCIDAAQQYDCQGKVDIVTAGMDSRVKDLEEQKKDAEEQIKGMRDGVNKCDLLANGICEQQCIDECESFCAVSDVDGSFEPYVDMACYNGCHDSCKKEAKCTLSDASMCFPNCHEEQINLCCQGYGGAKGWGRNCDLPCSDCDMEEGGNKCGLLPLADSIQKTIDEEIVPLVEDQKKQIQAITNCCSFPTEEQQWDCLLKSMEEE